MRPLDASAIRDALAEGLPGSARHGQEPPRLNRIYLPETHARALSPDSMVVRGARGTGKTFWWQCLWSAELRAELAHRFPRTRLTEISTVVPGFGGVHQRNHYPDPETIAQALRLAPPAAVWRAVVLWAVGAGLPRVSGWPERSAWVASHAEEARHRLQQAGDQAKGTLIVFDAVDRAARDRATLVSLHRGLLEVLLEVRQMRGLRAKAFLRADLLDDPGVTGFPDASKILREVVDLRWLATDLYGLLFHYLGNVRRLDGSPHPGARAFRSLCGGEADADDSWRVPEAARRIPEEQERLLIELAGRWMGGPRRGRVYPWLPNHLADGRGEISPRSFLVAVQTAASETPADHELPISVPGLIQGVAAASKVRVSELADEEHPWIRVATAPLRGLHVPAARAELVSRWKGGHTLDAIRKQGVVLPAHFAEGEEGLLNELAQLGILRDLPDGRVQVPDIYRVELGIVRKGGVPTRLEGSPSSGPEDQSPSEAVPRPVPEHTWSMAGLTWNEVADAAPRLARQAVDDPGLRRRLFAGIDEGLVASLPMLSRLIDQFLSDLHQLATAGLPEAWQRYLTNAARMAETREDWAFFNDLLAHTGGEQIAFLWDEARGRLEQHLHHRLKALYYEALDVRPALHWPDPRRSVVVHGPSGVGKSWLLAALARRQAREEWVVWLEAGSNIGELRSRVAEVLRQEGLSEDPDPLDLAALLRRVERGGGRRIFVFVDGLVDERDIERIAESFQLNPTCPVVVALPQPARPESLSPAWDAIELLDFTAREVEVFLDRRDIDWADLERPTLDLLRRPLLAKMFADTGGADAPRQERDVFLKYWEKLYAFEKGALADLALRLFRGELPFPIPIGKVDHRDLQALASRGHWLRIDQVNLHFLHDRLLTWAVVEGLTKGPLTDEDLEALPCSGFDCKDLPQRREVLRHLGGLPAHLLWRLSHASMHQEAARILAAFDRRGYLDADIRHQLDEVGASLLPAIELRLRMDDASEYASASFDEIMESHSGEAWQWAVDAQGRPHPRVDELAARILTRRPAREAMDALWLRVGQAENEDQREIPERALLAAIAHWPEWLAEQLESEALSPREVIGLLGGLEDEPGEAVWQRIKAPLFQAADLAQRSALARCVGTFRDRSELDRIESWLAAGDGSRLLTLWVLRALVFMEPQRALQQLARLQRLDASVGARVLSMLAIDLPVAIADLLAKKIAEADEAALEWAVMVWSAPEVVDSEPLAEAILDAIARGLSDEGEDDRLASILIRAAERMDAYPLFHAAARRKGSRLEDKLFKLARSEHHPRRGGVSPIYEGARALLLAMGGSAAHRLMALELETDGWRGLVEGEAAALASPEVVRQVKDHALGRHGGRGHQQSACLVLARLGHTDEVVDALLEMGPDVAGDPLLFKLTTTPMGQVAYDRALEAASSTDERTASAGRIAIALSKRPEAVRWLLTAPVDAKRVQWCQAYALRELAKVPELLGLFIDALNEPASLPRTVDALWEAGRDLEDVLFRRLLPGIEPRALGSMERLTRLQGAVDDVARVSGWRGARSRSYELGPESSQVLRREVRRGEYSFADRHGWLIRRFAQEDPQEAWWAARRFFEHRKGIDEADLLLDLDRAQALPYLLSYAVDHSELCEVIGIALDRYGEGPDLDTALRDLAIAPQAPARRVAVCLVGWRTDGTLGDLLQDGLRHFTTQDDAREALWRHRLVGRAHKLLEGVASADGVEQWRRLRAFSACCDPKREATADARSVFWRAGGPALDPLLSRRMWDRLQRPKR